MLLSIFTSYEMARATLQRWEVARGWRLGRRTEIDLLRLERPARCQVMRMSRRGRRRQIPGACVPRAGGSSEDQANIQLVCGAITAQPGGSG